MLSFSLGPKVITLGSLHRIHKQYPYKFSKLQYSELKYFAFQIGRKQKFKIEMSSHACKAN
jgi:hypothetical protein